MAAHQHRGDGHQPPLRSTLPGCLAVTWPYAPPHPGVGSTEEVRATFSGEVGRPAPADAAGIHHPNNKEVVRLVTWGDPYLTAWLGAVRGEPLAEAGYLAAGLAPGSNPLRQARRERS
jgi:hypothetical protein